MTHTRALDPDKPVPEWFWRSQIEMSPPGDCPNLPHHNPHTDEQEETQEDGAWSPHKNRLRKEFRNTASKG